VKKNDKLEELKYC